MHTLNPKQLSILTKVVEEYCSTAGIGLASEREDTAYRALHLFNQGFQTPEELREALEKSKS